MKQLTVTLKEEGEKRILESEKRFDHKIKDLLNLFGTQLQGVKSVNENTAASHQANINSIEKQITQLSKTHVQ